MHARLAMIILCDQVSRCIHRGDKKAFEHDALAVQLSREILEHPDQLTNFTIFERLNIISPLVHSESKSDVELSIILLEKVLAYSKEEADIEVTDYIENTIGFARDHL